MSAEQVSGVPLRLSQVDDFKGTNNMQSILSIWGCSHLGTNFTTEEGWEDSLTI